MVSTYIMCVVSGVTKSEGPKNSSVHSDSLMVPHGSQQSDITLEEEGDANEQLYQSGLKRDMISMTRDM